MSKVTKEYCSVCKDIHTMHDGGDIYDCMLHDRKKNPRTDENIEIWNGKEWIKRESFYSTNAN